ncbi:hypothetical protein GCM10008019_28400 [Deinococcus soli (ex Cha et al. 2016)]|nr:hypothetical protein GCM10008019_28400 [Deinococcus soli (ex Cha et al. 2016)]
MEADGWRRDAERLSEPYLDGRQMLTIQYTHGGRTVTLTLMTDTSVSVHPQWYPSGRTEGFVHWDRLATRMRDLQAHPTSQETV